LVHLWQRHLGADSQKGGLEGNGCGQNRLIHCPLGPGSSRDEIPIPHWEFAPMNGEVMQTPTQQMTFTIDFDFPSVAIL
jgi:hypothetical protein